MSREINGVTYYTPKETAERLGVSLKVLQYLRLNGRIEGLELGTMTLYNDKQIANANLKHQKPGPKSSKKSEQAGGDENGQGNLPSVI